MRTSELSREAKVRSKSAIRNENKAEKFSVQAIPAYCGNFRIEASDTSLEISTTEPHIGCVCTYLCLRKSKSIREFGAFRKSEILCGRKALLKRLQLRA